MSQLLLEGECGQPWWCVVGCGAWCAFPAARVESGVREWRLEARELSPWCQKLGFAEVCPQKSVTCRGLETNPHPVLQSPLHRQSLDRTQADHKGGDSWSHGKER